MKFEYMVVTVELADERDENRKYYLEVRDVNGEGIGVFVVLLCKREYPISWLFINFRAVWKTRCRSASAKPVELEVKVAVLTNCPQQIGREHETCGRTNILCKPLISVFS